MKKILLSLFLVSSVGLSAQTTVFEDSFETYTDFAIENVGAWTLIDVDQKSTYGFQGVTFANSGVAKSFQVFNAAMTEAPLTPSETSDWTARTGSKHMVCFAAASPAPSLNNDWLISPQITLGSTGNVLKFWAKSCDADYGLEKFKVGISAGNTTANVTLLSAGTVITPSTAVWTEYTYAIPATFNSQAVYISINCVSDDQFGFAVDDFKVTTTGTLATENFFKTNFAVYPNPANDVINVSNVNNLEITNAVITDINGRIVKNVNNLTEAINVSNLTTGVYFLKVSTANGEGVTKIVKN